MRKRNLFHHKILVAAAVCICIAGTGFLTHRAAASSVDAKNGKVLYAACENKDEEILYEDVDETISVQAVKLEEDGMDFDVSDEVALDNGYFHRIKSEKGQNVVAGITVDGTNYVVYLEDTDDLSDKEVQGKITSLDVSQRAMESVEALQESL